MHPPPRRGGRPPDRGREGRPRPRDRARLGLRRAHPREGRLSDRSLRQLVGVYDADGSLRGELTYFVGARLGRAHCSLCDITHGLVRERSEWRELRAGLPVPFETFHRDDQPDDVRAAHGGRLPAVVGVTDRGVVPLLGPDELDACAGSVGALRDAVLAAVERAGLEWPDRAARSGP